MVDFYIQDKQKNQYSVSLEESETWLFALVIWKRTLVGRISCVISESNDLEIGDIIIFEDPLLPKNGFFSRHPFQRPHRNFRNLGLGTAMLHFVVEQAQKMKVKGISGFVTQEDAQKTPYLLNWYQKNGFEVTYDSTHSTITIYRPIP